MMKNCLTLLLGIFIVFAPTSFAATKQKKTKATASVESKDKAKKSKKKKKGRLGKARGYKRAGNGPDLRALTTESASNSEFTETPGNGVNSVETKPGL